MLGAPGLLASNPLRRMLFLERKMRSLTGVRQRRATGFGMTANMRGVGTRGL